MKHELAGPYLASRKLRIYKKLLLSKIYLIECAAFFWLYLIGNE
jgi:hypothetical protein